MAFQKASGLWPESTRPLVSGKVTEIIRGSSRPSSSNTDCTAKIAALAFRVSKMVSIISRSAPPAIRARVASL